MNKVFLKARQVLLVVFGFKLTAGGCFLYLNASYLDLPQWFAFPILGMILGGLFLATLD
jgi:hypothetical protein